MASIFEQICQDSVTVKLRILSQKTKEGATLQYGGGEIDRIKPSIQQLFRISSELEHAFPGRKFTLDGHLVGSIGEVLASHYYGLVLLPPSAKGHDAIAPDGRLVQIKATQGMRHIALRSEPEHLIVLWIDPNTGNTREVYNGPGTPVWNACGKLASNGTRPISLSKLKRMATQVPGYQRLVQINPVEVDQAYSRTDDLGEGDSGMSGKNDTYGTNTL